MNLIACLLGPTLETVVAYFQIIATIATVAYLFATLLIFWQSKRSADAAEASAAAAKRSADSAQASADLALQQFAEQRGLVPGIVRGLIIEAYAIVSDWMGNHVIAPPPQGTPDPNALQKHSLHRAADLARTFSPECADILLRASGMIVTAQSRIEAAQQQAKHQNYAGRMTNPAAEQLKTVLGLLTSAREIAEKRIPSPKTAS